MKIPISCDFCGRTVIRITRANPEGQVNYADKCADCAEPRPALVVPFRAPVSKLVWRAAS